jgi:hypothetical protein
MTVSELILKLQEYSSDMPVKVFVYDDRYYDDIDLIYSCEVSNSKKELTNTLVIELVEK